MFLPQAVVTKCRKIQFKKWFPANFQRKPGELLLKKTMTKWPLLEAKYKERGVAQDFCTELLSYLLPGKLE